MILRQTIHLSNNTCNALELSQPKFISLCDHLLHTAELEADKASYELDSNAVYIRCCELLTAADMGAELSYIERLNLIAVVLEFYRGDPWRTME